jgi:2-hydroxy-3-keto-5-methylthiopentenyl-1-phosphate phosphatase
MGSSESTRSRAKWQVLVDFDGTIAPDDPTDRLLERFAEPQWRLVEAAWQAGRISSLECMRRQVGLLRVSPEVLVRAIAGTRIDPHFPAFLKTCQKLGAEVRIVSDGFDRVIGAALRAARLAVPYFANRLEWAGGDRWRLSFPFSRSECRVGSANCKCSHGALLAAPCVVVGDGRSDFCMSTRADFVIAKGALAEYCRMRGQPHAVFADFEDVVAHFTAWSASVEPMPIRVQRGHARSSAVPAVER